MLKRIFAFVGMLGVVLGAFGAHALKAFLSPNLLENWKTATLYLFVHALAGLYALEFTSRLRSAYSFLFGIFIFSGSLYIFTLTGQKFWALITPLGGVAFILGWFWLMLDIKKRI